MPSAKRSRSGKTKPAHLRSPVEEIEELTRRISDESPRRGWAPSDEAAVRFDTLPISTRTLKGLEGGSFETMKPIQRCAIPHALAGRDVLGAARTGSGKTLAFLIPALESLYRERWSSEDGLGSLVITPTRELALQIFQVLRTVGSCHDLSAGLVTGGKKDFAAEQARVGRMCLLVATPGRVLQHLEESPGFDASRALSLVVDEADRVVRVGVDRKRGLSRLTLGGVPDHRESRGRRKEGPPFNSRRSRDHDEARDDLDSGSSVRQTTKRNTLEELEWDCHLSETRERVTEGEDSRLTFREA